MSNWKKVKLEDICINITDGVHNTVKDTINEQYYLLSCKNIKNGNVCIDKHDRTIGKETLDRLRKRTQLSKGDVLLSSVGTIGETAIVKEEYPPYEFQRSVAIFKPDKRYITSKFLFYSLNNKKKVLQSMAEGAVQQCLFINPLKQFQISIPPLDEQKKIAGVLSVLDDKIELNNKINRNLEAQAQAIFKSWFIDFEPFKNGKFIDSELGKIPEGWSVGSFSEVSDLLGGGTPKTTNNKFWNGTIPFFTPKDAIDIFVIETDRLITKEGLENCNTKLYPKGIIFITARGTVGKISLSGIEMAMNQSCYAIIPKHNIPTLFLYYQTVLLVKKLKNKASGAVFDAITTRDFDEAIIIPPLSIMNKFSETIENIFGAILNNIIQAKVLSKARDTLLPKLISGEMLVLDSNL